jgi:hypothetical protein
MNNVAVLDNRGPLLTLPLGANFEPQGEVVPKGKFCPLRVQLSPGGEILCLPLHSSPQEVNEGGKHSPYGTNLTRWGQVHP